MRMRVDDLAVAVLLVAATGCAARQAGAPRPRAERSKLNVIIVLTDDQGYGDLGAHGNPVLKTPALDRLRAESIRLTDFHVAPVCTPTRGQLMTGQDALRNGAMNTNQGRTLLRREIPTMADLFSANGYQTALFGKWHLGDNYPFRPQDRGFRKAVTFPASHVGSAPDHWDNDYFDDHYRDGGRLRQFRGYTTDVFFEQAMTWIQERAARKEPFFAYLPLNAPHSPHFVPERDRAAYRNQPHPMATFFGMIANIDENIARLETMLRERGLAENTLLVFLTDNGGTSGVKLFNAGMRGRKGELYDGGHRVPCFIRWPARLPPRDIDDLTQVQDLLPTLVDLLNLDAPARTKFDGTSLAQLLRGEVEGLPDRMLVIQYSGGSNPRPSKGNAAVLWRGWRLVRDQELYDVKADPAQRNDIAAQHPDLVARMRAHYARWWAGVAPRLDERERIVIGSDAENPSLLSPADWEDVDLDTGRAVREGVARNGWWNVFVDRPGQYEITLRRWSAEADAALDAGLPPYEPTDREGSPVHFNAGKALPIAKARLAVSGFDESRATSPGDKAVTFTVTLGRGATRLQTWFHDGSGKELCGAYFVYVRFRGDP